MKWAVGTGIALLALVLGVVQWLFPQGGGGAGPGGGTASTSASASARPKSDLARTPMIGYEFWQDGAPALMQRGPETPEYVTYVTLAREPFEIHLPKPPGTAVVCIAAWSDASIFGLEQGADYSEHVLFGFGRGMANGEYFDGDLFLSNEGMTPLVGKRLTELSSTMDKVLVSAFSGTSVQNRSDPVYLTIFVDNNHDGRFDITEYEYIVLKFRPA